MTPEHLPQTLNFNGFLGKPKLTFSASNVHNYVHRFL